MNILVTGGAGFIGSNFLNLMVPKYKNITFINVDKLTYAANLANLSAINVCSNYRFEKCDIVDSTCLDEVFRLYKPDKVVHFAAESHVDRSICGPADFIYTNIIGTFNLLELCKKHWYDFTDKAFHHISTDEVYGSLGETGFFLETTRYDPSSPYSASKASSDHLVMAYYKTYKLPVKITNCSNNYGPYQHSEKLIPKTILNALAGKTLPIYGTGQNLRDWLYVEDHCEAIWAVLERGEIGETYNIGGNNEWTNYNVVLEICKALAELTGRPEADYKELITFVDDRLGHDYRYAIDATKIKQELAWQPKESFNTGIRRTINWYMNNADWHKGNATL